MNMHWLRRLKHRIFDGYDCCEVFDLDYSLAKHILPRLKAYKKMSCGHPAHLTEKRWNNILDKMIYSFENIVDDDRLFDMGIKAHIKELEKVDDGLRLFGKYFRNLWI